jgi:ABC-type multidrug transport system fused ATPase/permease subunit
MLETILQALNSICSWLASLCSWSVSLSGFNHLLAMAFGSGLAYAVLIRTGNLQGRYLEAYCNARHADAVAAYKLLTIENPELEKSIALDANKIRCNNHVSECRQKIFQLSKYFAMASVVVALLCVIMMLVAAVWDPLHIPVIFIVPATIMAFAPVPFGLGWTYHLVRNSEKSITDEYNSLFEIQNVLKVHLKKETENAIQEIKKKLGAKKRSVFERMLSGHWVD